MNYVCVQSHTNANEDSACTSCYRLIDDSCWSLSLSQRPSRSTLAFQFPTDVKGADITLTPVTLSVNHDTHTMITTHTMNTHTGDITTTERSPMTMTKAQSVTTRPISQVRNNNTQPRNLSTRFFSVLKSRVKAKDDLWKKNPFQVLKVWKVFSSSYLSICQFLVASGRRSQISCWAESSTFTRRVTN